MGDWPPGGLSARAARGETAQYRQQVAADGRHRIPALLHQQRGQLQSADYLHVGADLAAAGLPTVFVFEGGYAVDEVGVNAVNVLYGFGRQAANQQ